MTERQLQFRVGLFVLGALIIGAVLIIQFSDIKSYWKETYALAIHFPEAPGMQAGSPVKQNGIPIGRVKQVLLDEENGGVLIVVDIESEYQLRLDAEPVLSQSLFGESKIQFNTGVSPEFIPPNSRLEGTSPVNPMELVQKLEQNVDKTLTLFGDTSREWQTVGQNLNALMETKEGQLDDVIEQTAVSLTSFNRTMESASTAFDRAGTTLETATQTLTNANQLITDPQLHEDLRRTAAALPKIAEETHQTILAARTSIQQVQQNLDTINSATAPLAKQSDVIVRRLTGSLIQLEQLLTEMNTFSQVLNSDEGSFQQLAQDPTLYKNLNQSAASLNVMLQNLEPIMRDVNVFSDKIARHPELLGVSGAMKGSTGIKEDEPVQRAGFSTPPTIQR